jgi:hypothetical protein
VLLLAAALGLAAGEGVNRELRTTWAERPAAWSPPAAGDPLAALDPAGPVALLPPLDPFAVVEVPGAGSPAVAELYGVAATALADALALRTGHRPAIRVAASAQGAGAGSDRAVVVSIESGGAAAGFRVEAASGAIRVRAGTPLEAAHGMAYLRERLLAGAAEPELATGSLVQPAFETRLVDLGGVGILPDPAAWAARDYSHHNRAFLHVLSREPPYVDATGFAAVREDFRTYVTRMATYGYDGIVFKGFLEFVDFDRVGDGFEVYPAGSPFRERHRVLRHAFGELFEHARAMGMKVVLSTDMVALTPPLEAYLFRRFGRIDASDPALWEVYALGLSELLERMPAVDGLMVRVGETGSVFNLEGWEYRSELYVRSVPALRAMLTALAGAAGEHERTLYFRSWSVGIGDTGGMHTRPEVYARIFDGLDLPNLVVSTKYVAGDFYSHLPLNPTLEGGAARRMVELQSRREYDGFAAFPNYMAPEHQSALQRLRSANPRLLDLWVWTQEGGPPRVSPRSLYPFHGFWQLIDADVYAAARLGWDPDTDVGALTRAWVRGVVGGDTVAVERLAEILLTSRQAVLDGLYIEPYARRQVHALGLDPPPMLWIFEWDIVTGSSAALSTIYLLSRDELESAIAGGWRAVDEVRRKRRLLAEIDPDRVARPGFLESLERSLAYQEDLLVTLAHYREAFLSHHRWLDTGDRAARARWRRAADAYAAGRAAHVERYGADLDFRAYSFRDADTGAAHAERGMAMAWLARLLLMLTAVVLLLERSGGWEQSRLRTAVPLALLAAAALVFSSFGSVGLFVAAGSGAVAFLSTLLLQTPRAERTAVQLAATHGLLWLAMVALVPIAVRGPGYFWLRFWTSDGFRSLLVLSAFVAAGWLAVSVHSALRRGCGCRGAGAAGRLVAAAGAPLVVLAALLELIGLERSLTILNDELAVLPMGLSSILGITTHLGIPLTLPLHLGAGGVLLLAVGGGLRLLDRPGRASQATPASFRAQVPYRTHRA